MMQDNVSDAERLMAEFASRTMGPKVGSSGVRYLWTDAFAVCNYLALYVLMENAEYLRQAIQLVDQVHNTLGRHRVDDRRTGWISRLSEAEGRRHPTRGGLRIGKPLNEREPGKPYDESREWDRDGQYFHYLTKWMLALNRLTLATGETKYNAWAIELAEAAHRAFVYLDAERRPRMYWKMSIDLTRPLVPSMGQHDPLDGFVTCCQLKATRDTIDNNGHEFGAIQSDFRRLCTDTIAATTDELGIGGLLTDAAHLIRLTAAGKLDDPLIIDAVLRAAYLSLHHFSDRHRLDDPADTRLAFRELGLAIGLQSVPSMRDALVHHSDRFHDSKVLQQHVSAFERYMPIIDDIQRFWLNPESQRVVTWIEHLDINSVMLATCLVPKVYLLSGFPSFVPGFSSPIV